MSFYRRFLESPNFSAWFERQRAAAWAWQEAEWARAAEVGLQISCRNWFCNPLTCLLFLLY